MCLATLMRERLLACTEPECPIQVVVMQPSARAWHKHRGGILWPMTELFPADAEEMNARDALERSAT